MRILIVDDEEAVRKLLTKHFENHGFKVQTASNGEDGYMIAESTMPDAIITDVKMPNTNGFEFIEKLKKVDSDVPVIIITGFGDKDIAIEALKKGAFDFVEKPFDLDTITQTTRRAIEKRKTILENRKLLSDLENVNEKLKKDVEKKDRLLEATFHYEDFIGESDQIMKIKELLKRISTNEQSDRSEDNSIIIYGETGTGKRTIAANIHKNSKRKSKPFIRINCAETAENLLESELFGYEKGAFAGANHNHIGLFEAANGGTIFIDEIHKMDTKIQAKLLRVLQEKVIRRIGGVNDIPVDIRLISATHKNLKNEIVAKKFREDLYYKLSTITIDLPKLSQRGNDILILAKHFLMSESKSKNKEILDLDANTKDILTRYSYPGNVSELKNIIQRYVVLHDDKSKLLHINLEAEPKTENAENKKMLIHKNDVRGYTEVKKDYINKFEENFIRESLIQNNWNISKTAEYLKLDRSNFAKLMKKHKIKKPGDSNQVAA